MAEWGSICYTSGYSEGHDLSGNADITTLTASGTANNRGSWTALNTSTPFACNGVLLGAAPGNSNTPMAVELGVGGAGSEKVIMPDFVLSANSRTAFWVYVPCQIPASSRLSARLTSGTISATCVVYADLLTSGPLAVPIGGLIRQLHPVVTGGTYGTSVTPQQTTYSATWTQLSSSCPIDARAICVQTNSGTNTAPGGAGIQYELGVGAASSEVVVLNRVSFQQAANADVAGPGFSFWLPCQIAAGQRVALRAETNAATPPAIIVATWVMG